jgi:hypothetical protein
MRFLRPTLGERHVGLTGEILRRIEHQGHRHEQVLGAGVGDLYVVGNRITLRAINAYNALTWK